MAVRFDLFHLSLLPKVSLFPQFVGSREQWLRWKLAQPFTFNHWGSELYWVPAQDIDGLIFGRVERQVEHDYHANPDQGGHEIAEIEWQGAVVIIDPTHHDDGQKVAFEADARVGTPRPILANLFDMVNADFEAPYHVESKPIFDANDFWLFAKSHGNLVKRITFDFIVPNMWGTTSDLDKDLKETGVETGAQKVRTALISDEGVIVDSDTVRSGVEYAARGGGSFSAKSLDGEPFSSTETQKKSSIPNPTPGQIEDYLRRFAKRILGREQDSALDDPNSDGDNPSER